MFIVVSWPFFRCSKLARWTIIEFVVISISLYPLFGNMSEKCRPPPVALPKAVDQELKAFVRSFIMYVSNRIVFSAKIQWDVSFEMQLVRWGVFLQGPYSGRPERLYPLRGWLLQPTKRCKLVQFRTITQIQMSYSAIYRLFNHYNTKQFSQFSTCNFQSMM